MKNLTILLTSILLVGMRPAVAATDSTETLPFDIMQPGSMIFLAESDFTADEIMKLKDAGDIIPLETIIQNVQKQHQGRIIEIELEKEDNVYFYELELVDKNNVVWEMEYDAATGKLIKLEQDD